MLCNNFERLVINYKYLPEILKFKMIEYLVKDITSEQVLINALIENATKLKESDFVDEELEQIMLKQSIRLIELQIKFMFEEHFISEETEKKADILDY